MDEPEATEVQEKSFVFSDISRLGINRSKKLGGIQKREDKDQRQQKPNGDENAEGETLSFDDQSSLRYHCAFPRSLAPRRDKQGNLVDTSASLLLRRLCAYRLMWNGREISCSDVGLTPDAGG